MFLWRKFFRHIFRLYDETERYHRFMFREIKDELRIYDRDDGFKIIYVKLYFADSSNFGYCGFVYKNEDHNLVRYLFDDLNNITINNIILNYSYLFVDISMRKIINCGIKNIEYGKNIENNDFTPNVVKKLKYFGIFKEDNDLPMNSQQNNFNSEDNDLPMNSQQNNFNLENDQPPSYYQLFNV